MAEEIRHVSVLAVTHLLTMEVNRAQDPIVTFSLVMYKHVQLTGNGLLGDRGQAALLVAEEDPRLATAPVPIHPHRIMA